MTVDPEFLNSTNVDRARQDILAFNRDLDNYGGFVFSELTPTLDEFSRSRNFQQVPLTILLLEIAGIALFYTGLVAAIVVERQSEEIALLRGRGASVGQILGIYLVEGLTVGIPAALAAPFLAAAATSLLGLTPIFDGISGGDLLPTTVVPLAFLWAGIGVLLSLAMILLPAFVVARRGAIAQKRALSRPGPSIIQRYYLDFALVVLAALMLWELNERGSVFEPTSSGVVTSDPILLASPALIIAAAAAMIVRFYPMVLRLFAGFVTRVSGVTLSMGMWQVVRSPGQYTRLALLLMMAVAVGTFAASYQSTTDRSYEERARFEVGADVRGTDSLAMIYGSPADLEDAVNEIPGVAQASAMMRIAGSQSSGGSLTRPITVLGVEREMSGLAWFRDDFAEVPFEELLEPLGGAGGFAGLALSDGTTGIEMWVNSRVARADVSLSVRVRGAAGRYDSYALTGLSETGWRKVEAVFEKSGVVLEQPLELVAVWLTQPSTRTKSDDNALFIDDMSVFNAAGERTLVEDFEAGRRWRGIPEPGQIDGVFRVTDEEVHAGTQAARFGFVLGGGGRRRGMFVADDNIPLPAIASDEFVQITGIGVGDTTFIEFSGGLVPIVIRGVYELFPRLATRDGASIVMNRDHLSDWGETFQVLPGPLTGPTEV